MASGPTIPPQAYTRETLTTAFNWLQSQPESVKKLATTPDALVGLYLRAQRFGTSSLETEAPVSSQSFISDLKNLAEGLKQFEEPQAQKKMSATSSPTPSTNSPEFLPNGLNQRSWAMIHEVKSQLNLSSDAEAINMMIAVAYKSLKNLLA